MPWSRGSWSRWRTCSSRRSTFRRGASRSWQRWPLLGFPITVALAWIFERTPDGVRRSGAASGGAAGPSRRFRPDGRFVAAMGLGILIGLVVVGAGAFLRSGGEARVDGPRDVPGSIAVLPFQDMSSGQDQGWFGQGVAEEILNALGRVDGLAVAARTSSFRYATPGPADAFASARSSCGPTAGISSGRTAMTGS